MSTDLAKEQNVDRIRNAIRGYIVENILFGDGQALEDDTSFQEDGILDSTGMLEIITFAEEQFGIEIADSEVTPENLGTLRQVSRFVAQKMSPQHAAQTGC